MTVILFLLLAAIGVPLLLYLLALGVAAGHYVQLLVAVPVYLWGTMIRVRAEDRLLADRSVSVSSVNVVSMTPARVPPTPFAHASAIFFAVVNWMKVPSYLALFSNRPFDAIASPEVQRRQQGIRQVLE